MTDNGTGIPPEALDRVWGLFEQGTSDSPGAGVGLTICRTIAEQHGGRVTATNTPRGGASFLVHLPAGDRR